MAKHIDTCPVCKKQYENYDASYRRWCSVGCETAAMSGHRVNEEELRAVEEHKALAKRCGVERVGDLEDGTGMMCVVPFAVLEELDRSRSPVVPDIPKAPVRAHDLSRQGGGWLGAARSWLQHRHTTKGVHGDQITWGDPNARFELGADSVEELAAEVAAAAFSEQGDLKDAIGKLRGKHLRLEIEHSALVEELAAAKCDNERLVRELASANSRIGHIPSLKNQVERETLRASNAEANCERLGRELEEAKRHCEAFVAAGVAETRRADAAERREREWMAKHTEQFERAEGNYEGLEEALDRAIAAEKCVAKLEAALRETLIPLKALHLADGHNWSPMVREQFAKAEPMALAALTESGPFALRKEALKTDEDDRCYNGNHPSTNGKCDVDGGRK